MGEDGLAVVESSLALADRSVGAVQGIVVSHTHWDREWYLSFERFRMRLVDTIDLVLDILDQRPDFRYFMLDGQAVVLEDYLAIRPEQEDRLGRHIKDGRLLVGPWYVLSDEFLVSGESLVRNLLLGRRIASRYGRPMDVGYLPDTFGHPSQMPQVLAGFGMDSAVLYRGVQTDRSEFFWEAPDGTRVLAVYLPGGYCNAMVLSSSPQRFLDERMAPILEDLRRHATTSTVLLMNGCDHLAPRPDLPDVLAEANRRLQGEVHLRQGTLAEYVALVRQADPDLEVLRGEFRAGRPGRVTPGVISARMYLKQENFRTYTLLERGAEPLAAMAWLLGESYPTSYLWYAWRQFLQNQPHDSICGCSTDRVHRDMIFRYAAAQDVAEELVYRGAASVARHVAELQAMPMGREARVPTLGDGSPESPPACLAFNVLPSPRRELVRLQVHFLEPGVEFHVTDQDGTVVVHQVLARRPMQIDYDPRTGRFEREGKAYPVLLGVSSARQMEIARQGRWQRWQGEEVDLLVAVGLPACGYATFYLVPGLPSEPVTSDLDFGGDWAENSLVRVQVHRDGTFDVVDKRTGAVFRGLGALESGGDRGDEYTYCPPEEDAIFTTLGSQGQVCLVEAGPARVTFQVDTTLVLPRGLAEGRGRRSTQTVVMPVRTRISLSPESDRVEVWTEVRNDAEDHRLRVVFPTPIYTDVAHAQGQFAVDTRPIDIPEGEKVRAPGPDEEVEVSTFPHKAFVDVNDGEVGLAVLNRGITEYQVEPGPEGVRICLTLLRCVGWLSRPDLSTRYANAGPSLPTPEAQCPGRHVFQYAVLPHAGGWLEAGVHRQAESYITPIPFASALRIDPAGAGTAAAVHEPRDGAPRLAARLLRPEGFSFISVEPEELVFSALKKAEGPTDDRLSGEDIRGNGTAVGGEALVLRFYNAASYSVQARVRFGWTPREVRRADLAEQPLGEPLPITAVQSGFFSPESRGPGAQRSVPGQDTGGEVSFPVRGHEICTLRIVP